MRGKRSLRAPQPAARPALVLGAGTQQIRGLRVFSEWVQAVGEDPDGASEVQQAVLRFMEARRRAAEGIRSCFDGSAPAGVVSVRFAVETRSIERRLEAGNARFVEVEDGTPVVAETARCLEDALAGHDAVESQRASFLQSYDGRVSYTARFFFDPDAATAD